MAKTKRRKKARPRGEGVSAPTREVVRKDAPTRQIRLGPKPSLQNTVFAFMVTLGFLGFAVFFIFFYNEDANHYLYGALLGLTALGWLVIALRRWSSYRQRVRT